MIKKIKRKQQKKKKIHNSGRQDLAGQDLRTLREAENVTKILAPARLKVRLSQGAI